MCHGNVSRTNIIQAELDKSNASEWREHVGIRGFGWDNEIQGHLLSAYAIGHFFGNLMAGSLCAFFGPKKYMVVSMALTGAVQLASPFAAYKGPWYLYTLRILFGLCVSNKLCNFKKFYSCLLLLFFI